jgi:hypothetical protein
MQKAANLCARFGRFILWFFVWPGRFALVGNLAKGLALFVFLIGEAGVSIPFCRCWLCRV